LDVKPYIENLRRWIEARDFSGYDPYDALNSAVLRVLSFRQKFLRIAFIQIFKRLPVNLRPLLVVRKDYNPKGLGLFLWGYAKLYAREKNSRYLVQIDRLLELLEGLKSRGCGGNGWGYNFDWQSRAFFVPRGTPTVVNSSFIGHALLATWEMTGNKRALEMALPIRDFILRDLNRHKEKDGAVCFSYTPIDHYFVHNANLLGVSLLIRLYQYTQELDVLEMALAALAYAMKHQRDDGSWYYAEKESSHWVDSFHTGFNLEAIKVFLDLGYGEEWRPGFQRALDFYARRFFLADGTPKYYDYRTYPIDIHAPAQAVVFFSRMGPAYAELTRRILEWMMHNMQDPTGFFYFQKHRHYTNKIPYMRWCQAWTFHALSEYLYNSESGSS
jgi:rhamnogalacturonyl hydrolase YesR